MMDGMQRLAVADLGSNSFRLVVYALEPGRWWQHADEIRGAVRMSERFLPGDEAAGKAIKALRKHVAEQVARADWFHTADGDRLAGIGGTIRNLATAAEREAGVEHPGSAQGFRLTLEALDDLIDELASMPVSKRGRVP